MKQNNNYVEDDMMVNENDKRMILAIHKLTNKYFNTSMYESTCIKLLAEITEYYVFDQSEMKRKIREFCKERIEILQREN